jgi:hypothetical protein
MGDRANCIIQFDGKKSNRVWFYTHWSGSDLPGIVKTALAKKWRWDVDSYLARIIFCELVKDNEMEETGFGISLRQQDNEHPYLVVDIKNKKVFFEMPPGDEKYFRLKDEAKKGWSFEEYIKSGPDTMADVTVQK